MAPGPAARRPAALALAVFLASCLVFIGAAAAQGLVLDNLVLDNREGAIVVRFAVAVEDAAPIREMLVAGQSLVLRCDAALYRERTLWPDKSVAGAQLDILLSHDVLTRSFAARAVGGEQLAMGQDLEGVLREALGAVVMDLGPWSELDRGRHYSLDLSISLNRGDVPAWLKRTLFFWQWDAVPQADFQLDFDY